MLLKTSKINVFQAHRTVALVLFIALAGCLIHCSQILRYLSLLLAIHPTANISHLMCQAANIQGHPATVLRVVASGELLLPGLTGIPRNHKRPTMPVLDPALMHLCSPQ